jgi:hypothetical protein
MKACTTMPKPPATTIAALIEVMKTVKTLPPSRGGSLGDSVSMEITWAIGPGSPTS